MSCDLSDSSILQAYTEIVNGQGTNWLLLGYNDTRDIISLYGKGSNGLGEFVTHLRNEVLFGFLRFDNTNILIQHISEQVSGVRRARGLVHGRAVANLLKDHDQQIIVSSAADLREDALRSRIKSSNTDEAGDTEAMTDDAPRATSSNPTVSSPMFSPTPSVPATVSHLQPPPQPSYSAMMDAPVAPLPSAEVEAESRKPRGMPVQQSPLEPIPAESTHQAGSGSLTPTTSSSPHPSISNLTTATNGHHQHHVYVPSPIRELKPVVDSKYLEDELAKRLSLKARIDDDKMQGNQVTMTGFIVVQGGSSCYWKRRWFAIRGSTLYLYPSETSVSPTDALEIADISRSPQYAEEEVLIPNSFLIEFRGSGPYYFYADSPDIRREVIDNIAQIMSS
ncbi:hypothetical protein IWQ61_002043 [Dispira simplex]|nr:hypothetical protein IWQ61_002043 [Dispira simplex]